MLAVKKFMVNKLSEPPHTSKLVITGGSYAGYLVAWIIGHDHQFKAACSQRGVRSEEHTSELQSRRYLHSFPTRRSSDLYFQTCDNRWLLCRLSCCMDHWA